MLLLRNETSDEGRKQRDWILLREGEKCLYCEDGEDGS